MELAAPAKGRRFAAMTVMALVVAASIALLTTLRLDVAYFFGSAQATTLGEVTDVDVRDLEANTYVTLSGSPMASGEVRYERVLGNGSYAVFPLAGQRDVFVQVAVDDARAARDLARREFTGRLVTFGQLGGRAEPVRSYLSDQMGMPVSRESFVLLADEPPGSYTWALALGLMCLLFIVLNVFLLFRWFRPLTR